MNMVPTQLDIEEVDIATVDQQIEQHAQNIERIQENAVNDIGRELSGVQRLYRFRRDEHGFTGWLARRLPHISQRSAYAAIQRYEGIGEFAELCKLSNAAQIEAVSAAPDIKALIAERVSSGEVFTAAQVKEIKEVAAREADAFKAKLDAADKQALAAVQAAKADAEKRIRELEAQIVATDLDRDEAPALDFGDAVAAATKAKDDEIAALRAKLDAAENDPAMKAMREAVADAAKNAGRPAPSRKNPIHNPDADVNRTLGVTGPCRQLLVNAKKIKPADVWKGFHDEEHRAEGFDLLTEVRDLINSMLETFNAE